MRASERSRLTTVENVPQCASSAFELQYAFSGGRHTLILTGELDIASCPGLNAAIAQILANARATLMLDLHKLTFIDSSGIHAVLLTKRLCAERGCEFLLVPGRAQIQRAFTITGLLDHLPFQASAPIRPAEDADRGQSAGAPAESDRSGRLREDYRMMLLVHDQGVSARVNGLPCRPPEGYDIAIGLDLVGIWTAGWEGADRELARQPESNVA